MEQSDGTPITRNDDFYFFNKVPCTPIGQDCYFYHSPVDAIYDENGLVATGASSFTLYKLRSLSGISTGQEWLADRPLHVSWHVSWPFSPDDPDRFSSVLKIRLWYIQNECVTQAFYNLVLPAMGQSVDVEPEITTNCAP